MMKKNKTFVLTSIVSVLPLVMGLVVYNQLPKKIAIHWSGGAANTELPRIVAVIGLPLLMLAINYYMTVRRNNDPSKESQSEIGKTIQSWITPVISVVLIPIVFFIALGHSVQLLSILYCLAGCALLIIGNYLPKTKKNYLFGFKTAGSLEYPDIWKKTNTMAGYTWVIGGICVILQAFLFPGYQYYGIPITAVITILAVAIPQLYSSSLLKTRNKY